ncbi:MAG TPA: hypothetical protein VG457_01635 [Planctomycetota bacterium]|nr:hypothetical protein [Planctomycetota bacterium]
MICGEVQKRLPEEDEEILHHTRSCEACRRLSESYGRDVLLLRQGLLDLAAETAPGPREPRIRPRWLFPLAVAAGTFLGVLSFLLWKSPVVKVPEPVHVDPAEQDDGEAVRRREEALRSLADSPVRRGQVVGIAEGSGYVSISAGKTSQIQVGDELTVCRRGVFVAKVVVTEVGDLQSQSQVAFRESQPRLGDDVFDTVPIPPADRKAALDYLFSFRPVEEKDRAGIEEAARGLGSEDPAVRKKSLKDLLQGGAPARVLLEKKSAGSPDEEPRARLKEAFDRWAQLEELLGGPGAERDVEFLALVDDARAYERLKRILSAVQPFSKEGFPAPSSGLASALRVWWKGARGRILWNPTADRYEERNP